MATSPLQTKKGHFHFLPSVLADWSQCSVRQICSTQSEKCNPVIVQTSQASLPWKCSFNLAIYVFSFTLAIFNARLCSLVQFAAQCVIRLFFLISIQDVMNNFLSPLTDLLNAHDCKMYLNNVNMEQSAIPKCYQCPLWVKYLKSTLFLISFLSDCSPCTPSNFCRMQRLWCISS